MLSAKVDREMALLTGTSAAHSTCRKGSSTAGPGHFVVGPQSQSIWLLKWCRWIELKKNRSLKYASRISMYRDGRYWLIWWINPSMHTFSKPWLTSRKTAQQNFLTLRAFLTSVAPDEPVRSWYAGWDGWRVYLVDSLIQIEYFGWVGLDSHRSQPISALSAWKSDIIWSFYAMVRRAI